MLKIKQADNTRCWRGRERQEPLPAASGVCALVHYGGKQGVSSLQCDRGACPSTGSPTPEGTQPHQLGAFVDERQVGRG